jgi:hypothetical protein
MVYGEQLRAVFESVVPAHYHCRYYRQDRKVKDIWEGVFYPTRFALPQGSLSPLTPQDSMVVYGAKLPRHRAPSLFPVQQLLLFEVVHIP